jgi:hypothetical protein
MDLTAIIRSYIYDKRFDGALFINGGWGLGKSYYLREKLIPKLQEKDPNQKFIYVSLNGLTDAGQISHLIAMEKWPFTKGKVFKVGKTIAGFLLSAVDHIPGVKAKFGEQSADKLGTLSLEDFLNFENTVLCFDDFERNKVQLAVLGFINTHLVETAHVKTIIIGNESEIEKADEYYRIKEKVIFRTIQFNTTVPLQVLLTHYKDDQSFFDLITHSLLYVDGLVKDYDIKNLRTLIFFLDILNRITLAQVFKDNKALNEAIYLSALIISNEFKEGALTSTDYEDYKNLDSLSSREIQAVLAGRQLRTSKEKNLVLDDTTTSYEIQFYEKYKLGKAPDFFFFKSIYNFILCGDLDEEQLRAECQEFEKIQEANKVGNSRQKEALKVLQSLYWAKNDQEINEAITTALTAVDNGDYFFYEYAALSDLLTQARSLGFIKGRQDHLKARIKRGLAASIKKSPVPESYLYLLQQQFYQGKDKDINKIILDEFTRRDQNAGKNSADSFFTDLEGDWANIQQKYSAYEPFKILPPKSVAKKLLACSDHGLRMFNSLLSQHLTVTNIASFLGQYKKQYKDLKDTLAKKSRSEKSGLRKLILDTTIRQLEELDRKLP